jgi:hypothetical protein
MLNYIKILPSLIISRKISVWIDIVAAILSSK